VDEKMPDGDVVVMARLDETGDSGEVVGWTNVMDPRHPPRAHDGQVPVILERGLYADPCGRVVKIDGTANGTLTGHLLPR
jgi:hypothetical protein